MVILENLKIQMPVKLKIQLFVSIIKNSSEAER